MESSELRRDRKEDKGDGLLEFRGGIHWKRKEDPEPELEILGHVIQYVVRVCYCS